MSKVTQEVSSEAVSQSGSRVYDWNHRCLSYKSIRGSISKIEQVCSDILSFQPAEEDSVFSPLAAHFLFLLLSSLGLFHNPRDLYIYSHFSVHFSQNTIQAL